MDNLFGLFVSTIVFFILFILICLAVAFCVKQKATSRVSSLNTESSFRSTESSRDNNNNINYDLNPPPYSISAQVGSTNTHHPDYYKYINEAYFEEKPPAYPAYPAETQ